MRRESVPAGLPDFNGMSLKFEGILRLLSERNFQIDLEDPADALLPGRLGYELIRRRAAEALYKRTRGRITLSHIQDYIVAKHRVTGAQVCIPNWVGTKLEDVQFIHGDTQCSGHDAVLAIAAHHDNRLQALHPISRSESLTELVATDPFSGLSHSFTGLMQEGEQEWSIPRATITHTSTIGVVGDATANTGNHHLLVYPNRFLDVLGWFPNCELVLNPWFHSDGQNLRAKITVKRSKINLIGRKREPEPIPDSCYFEFDQENKKWVLQGEMPGLSDNEKKRVQAYMDRSFIPHPEPTFAIAFDPRHGAGDRSLSAAKDGEPGQRAITRAGN